MAKTKVAALPRSTAKNAYELLSEVCALILAEPLRYDQGNWLYRGDTAREVFKRLPTCGTVGCVAGWAVALKGRPDNTVVLTIEAHAQEILGLEDVQCWHLFNGEAAKGTPQTLAHAKSGAAHIRRFQAKHKRQLQAKAV